MKERISIFLEKASDVMKTKNKKRKNQNQNLEFKINEINRKFVAAMDDDFNTPKAIAAIFELVNLGNTRMLSKDLHFAKDAGKLVKELCGILGLSLTRTTAIEPELKKKAEKLIKERDTARCNKNFKKADEIRKGLLKQGIILEDTKEGTVWRGKV